MTYTFVNDVQEARNYTSDLQNAIFVLFSTCSSLVLHATHPLNLGRTCGRHNTLH